MAGIQIGLVLLFLLFYILTRTVWIKIIKEEKLTIEVHLPLLALCLTANEKNNKRKKKKGKLNVQACIKAVSGMFALIPELEVYIEKVHLPCRADFFGPMTLVNPFAYQGFLYAGIAYLKTKAKRLVLSDNAIISSPDITEAHYYVTVKSTLFHIIFAILAVIGGIFKQKMQEG